LQKTELISFFVGTLLPFAYPTDTSARADFAESPTIGSPLPASLAIAMDTTPTETDYKYPMHTKT